MSKLDKAISDIVKFEQATGKKLCLIGNNMKRFKHKPYSLGFTIDVNHVSDALLRYFGMKGKSKGGKMKKGCGY